jgi:hypothetical protein
VLKHLRHNENARDVELLLRKVPQAWSIYQVSEEWLNS